MNISTSTDLELHGDFNQKAICSFCNHKKPSATWTTKDMVTLYVCPYCAVNTLPRFMADALMDQGDENALGKHWDQAATNYWKALAFNIRRVLINRREKI